MTVREKTSGAAAIDVAVAVSCDYWLREIDFDAEALAREVVPMAFAMADIPARIGGVDVEFSVVLTDDETIKALNRDYRGKDKPTNVLSFAALDAADADMHLLPDQPWPMGDIVLAFETIEKEVIGTDKSFRDHYVHLLIHGTLHLLGYDHEEDEEAEEMETLEIRILKKYGIENPYSSPETVA
jgi:probable rRNA maturation factor